MEQSSISLEAFYEYDKDFPLDPQVSVVQDKAGYSLHHVSYRSTHDVRVTGLLSLPESMSDPVPVIILVHGMGDSKTTDYMEIGNRIFLQHGYAVLRIDAHNHGERKQFDFGVDLPQGYPYWSRNIVVQTVFDLRRAVDFLSTRAEIDPSRIGYFGISLGGLIGTVFVAVEERVRVPVIALAGGGLNMLFGIHALSPEVNEFLSVIEPLNFVDKISPRPMLMINAEQDETLPSLATKRLYARAKKPKEIIWFDTDHHEIPPEQAFAEGVKWFDRHLN